MSIQRWRMSQDIKEGSPVVSVSTEKTMDLIGDALRTYEQGERGLTQGAGPLRAGELLNLSQSTIGSILEVYSAWKTTVPVKVRSEEARMGESQP